MFHCASAFAQAEKFGWELQFNVRKYGGGTMRTDICVIDPKDREKIYSVVGVYRKLGIEPLEPTRGRRRKVDMVHHLQHLRKKGGEEHLVAYVCMPRKRLFVTHASLSAACCRKWVRPSLASISRPHTVASVT